MWSSVRSGLSRKGAAPLSSQDATTPPPSSNATYRRSQLDKMMQEITSDLSNIVAQEQASVRSQLASKAREHCMKDISHDLRTPLNAIIGFAQMMENGALGQIENPQYIEYLRHIRESGYELLGQVEDLLNDESSVGSSQLEAKLSKNRAGELEEAVA